MEPWPHWQVLSAFRRRGHPFVSRRWVRFRLFWTIGSKATTRRSHLGTPCSTHLGLRGREEFKGQLHRWLNTSLLPYRYAAATPFQLHSTWTNVTLAPAQIPRITKNSVDYPHPIDVDNWTLFYSEHASYRPVATAHFNGSRVGLSPSNSAKLRSFKRMSFESGCDLCAEFRFAMNIE